MTTTIAASKFYVIKEAGYKRNKLVHKYVKNSNKPPEKPVFFKTLGEAYHAVDIINVHMAQNGIWGENALEYDKQGYIVPSDDIEDFTNDCSDMQYCSIDEVYEDDVEVYKNTVKAMNTKHFKKTKKMSK